MTASTINRNIGHGPRAPCFRPGLIAAGLASWLLASSAPMAQGGAGEADQAKHEPVDPITQLEAQGREENYQHTDQTFAALEKETAEIYHALATFTPREVSTA